MKDKRRVALADKRQRKAQRMSHPGARSDYQLKMRRKASRCEPEPGWQWWWSRARAAALVLLMSCAAPPPPCDAVHAAPADAAPADAAPDAAPDAFDCCAFSNCHTCDPEYPECWPPGPDGEPGGGCNAQ